MQTIIANRTDFFPAEGCPIAFRTISGDAPRQHSGDLTDVRHTHDFSELIIITAGGGLHWINGDTYEVSAGDIFLIQGNTEHYFLERHDLEMFNIMFDDEFLQNHLRSLRSLSGFNAFFLFEPAYRRRHRFQSHLRISPEAMLPLKSLLSQMDVESSTELPGGDLLMLARLLEIFVLLSRQYGASHNPKMRSLYHLGQVISRLEKRYQEDWTVARLCKIAAMAPSTLLPVFRKVTGCSPMEYLLKVRLEKAGELLLKTDWPISRVASSCGFHDSNYFSRQFRCHYHCTPRERRKRSIV